MTYISGGGGYTLHVSLLPTIPGADGQLTVYGDSFYAFTPNSTGAWEFYMSNNG